MSTETPRTDAAALDQREGVTHPDLCETYMAWTDYWALRECSRTLERELTAARQENERLREALRSLIKHGGPVIEHEYKCGTVADRDTGIVDLSSSVTFPAARAALVAARRALGKEG